MGEDQKSSHTTCAPILGLAPKAHSLLSSGQQDQRCPYSQPLGIESRPNYPIKESRQSELWNVLEFTPFPQLQGSASPLKEYIKSRGKSNLPDALGDTPASHTT